MVFVVKQKQQSRKRLAIVVTPPMREAPMPATAVTEVVE